MNRSLKAHFVIILLFFGSLSATPLDDPNYTPWNYGYVVADAEVQSFYTDPDKLLPPAEEDKPEIPLVIPEHPDHLYKLKPGDRLLLSVYGEPTSSRMVNIDFNGTFSYLFISTYPAIGKTVEQIKIDLEEKLKTYYRDPILLVTLVESLGEYYTVVGELLDPGIKQLTGHATVLTAISEAHGVTLRFFRDQLYEIGDLDHAFLSRHGEYIPVNFRKLISEGDMTQNIPLKHGDYIYIPSKEVNQIFILGEVNSPITFEYFDTMTLSEAIAEAGGVTHRASSRVAVIRGSISCPTRYLIDVNRIWKGFARDFVIEPGDIIFVPPMQFTTLKEIVREGVRSFVSSVANVAGSNAYLQLNPKAVGFTNSPVPVFSSGGTFVAPAVSAPAATGGGGAAL